MRAVKSSLPAGVVPGDNKMDHLEIPGKNRYVTYPSVLLSSKQWKGTGALRLVLRSDGVRHSVGSAQSKAGARECAQKRKQKAREGEGEFYRNRGRMRRGSHERGGERGGEDVVESS